MVLLLYVYTSTHAIRAPESPDQFNTQINDSTQKWRLPLSSPPLWQPDGQWAMGNGQWAMGNGILFSCRLPRPCGGGAERSEAEGVFIFSPLLLPPIAFLSPIKKPLPIAVGVSVRNPEEQGGASSQIPTFHSEEAWSSPSILWLPIRDSKGSNLSDRPRWAAFNAPYHINTQPDPPNPRFHTQFSRFPPLPPQENPTTPIPPISGTAHPTRPYRPSHPPHRERIGSKLPIEPTNCTPLARRTRAGRDSGRVSRYARCSIVIHEIEALP